jgi:hypothetical protein
VGHAVKVLFILGTTRCGSTILENVLGSIPGFFAAGEVHMLWRGMERGYRCGCGDEVASCPVWTQILIAAGAPADPLEVERWQRDEVRILHAPRLLRIQSWPRTGRPSLDRYVDLVRRLYPEIARVGEAQVVVDSSKTPSASVILSHLDEIELYVIHLVRDPRGVAYSWKRGYPAGKGAPGPRNYSPGAIRTTGRWIATNLLGDAVRRRLAVERQMLLRYEDFVANPEESVRRIVDLVGEPVDWLPFVSPHVVRLQPNHCVSGNRSRFSRGVVRLTLDDEWRSATDASRSLVTALSLPWLRRYGYAMGQYDCDLYEHDDARPT